MNARLYVRLVKYVITCTRPASIMMKPPRANKLMMPVFERMSVCYSQCQLQSTNHENGINILWHITSVYICVSTFTSEDDPGYIKILCSTQSMVTHVEEHLHNGLPLGFVPINNSNTNNTFY